ncbi:conserved exported hypothetical protein [Sphingomonas sp. EC-HK361]|uniref:DUF1223 domain-containing protein n=1 Tax=Sphingomonas sp. EC-HK361 TaxID=2038397 RepID=UPI001257613E|nr:DUF1223 domain-containing protein [Sphingomonas sp. EC-HK361]VVT21868.1 conserved exported hypothetical protein [Sphingomonas sp. EC-HK361]
MRTLATLIAIALTTGPAFAADPAHPAVVELYQSQGCSSCPPADLVLNALADRPDVLALSFAVTYWDQLGWKDTFGSPAFTTRQWDYAHAGGRGNVATPQVVINGRGVVTGNRRADIDAAIRRFDRGAGGPGIGGDGRAVTVGAGAGKGTLWLVRYDPRTIAVPIRAGENGGRTIPHRNIVRQLIALGPWTGTPARYALPAAPRGLATAVLLQAGKGGPIVAARRL